MSSTTIIKSGTRTSRDTRLRDYLIGAFGCTWALWVPAGLDARGTIDLPLPALALVVVGSFGPMISALVAAARHGGWRETKQLLARLTIRGLAKRWLVLALVLGAVTITPAVAYLVTGGATDTDAVLSHLAVMPLHFLIVFTIGGGLDEEVGWRGMAQPQLQRHLHPLAANLLLGLIWATWHLPLWLDPNSPQAAYPFLVYTLVILGHSLVTGYLYNASGGSLLIAVLVHSSNNTFDGLRYAVMGRAEPLPWQLVLAATSLALGAALALRTRGRLGLTDATSPVHSSADEPALPQRQ